MSVVALPVTRVAGLSGAEAAALAGRHGALLAGHPLRRVAPLLVLGLVVLYSVYCWWFFAIGETLRRTDFSIAGSYLADWVSYESRPDLEIAPDGAMQVVWPRFDPLGPEPRPDWLVLTRATMERAAAPAATPATTPATTPMTTPATPSATPPPPARSATGFMGAGAQLGASPGQAAEAPARAGPRVEEVVQRAQIAFGAAARVTATPTRVEITRGDETLVLAIDPHRSVRAQGPLPSWATQKRADGKVIAWLGFAGRAEIESDAVKIRRRFLGWENFLFDTDSRFFGMGAAQLWTALTEGPRLDPARSNLSLAWNDILHNGEWQHLDVWTKLLQTVVMAFVGTLLASLVAFPLAFLAARTITRSRPANQAVKRVFDFLRSVDMFIWALFFTRAFGPGPLAGIAAIFFTDTGTLGKLYAETLENLDERQREGVRSVGAAPALVQRFGVLPQVLPLFASHALYFWESNTRSATIIGAVGAGGIGLKLWEAMRTNQDWENVAYMVLLILVVVFVFDRISTGLRMRLIGGDRS